MKTRIITVLLLSIAALAGVAQTRSVQFSYDHAGNRTSRAIVLPAAAQSRRTPSDSTQTEVFTDIFAEYQLHVYPNPTHGELKIELRGLPEGCSVLKKVDRLNLESDIGLHWKSLFLYEFTHCKDNPK